MPAPGGVPAIDELFVLAVLALNISSVDSPGSSDVASGSVVIADCTNFQSLSAPDTSRIATALISLYVLREPSAQRRR